MTRMKFVKTHNDPNSAARCGIITTDHGQIETPIFMPVGTVGSVKGIYHRDLKEDIKAQIHKKNNEEINNITVNTIQAVMDNARVNLSNKQSFIGALNFLNSQASIALIKKNSTKFEATA